MTLTRDRGMIVAECDECGDLEETETSNFDKAREHLRAEGWATRNVSGRWKHFCRSCS